MAAQQESMKKQGKQWVWLAGAPLQAGSGWTACLLSAAPLPSMGWASTQSQVAHLTREMKADPCLSHALALRAAWALGNYHCFFRLYCHAPCISGYLVDKFADRERKTVLKAKIKTLLPVLPVTYLQAELGLSYIGPDNSSVDCCLSLA